MNSTIDFPQLTIIRQDFSKSAIDNAYDAVLNEIERIGLSTDLSGKTIGITAGSRGIDRIAEVTRAVVDWVRACGGTPVIIPAMGSHGGGTAAGQLETLAGVGITQESVGAPIKASAEVEKIGVTASGVPVYCNREATRVDAIFLVNRIKKHTDYTGSIESGLHKIMTIGLGSAKGADTAHKYAMLEGYEGIIVSFAQIMLAKLPILGAVGLVENAYNKLTIVEAITVDDLKPRETELLQKAKTLDARLPMDRLHVLVIGEIGKNISGSGMDTNVVGRLRMLHHPDPELPEIDRIVVLSLTPESHGNALGIGLADLTTQRVCDAVDTTKTALNCVTSMTPEAAAIPCTLATDKDAIAAAIHTAAVPDNTPLRLAYIQNTKKLTHLAVSPALVPELESDPKISILKSDLPMDFDDDGNLMNFQYAVTP